MNKTVRKLVLHRESLRNLTSVDLPPVRGAAGTRNGCPSIQVGCTTENTWYCPTASACSNCPLCNA